MDDERRICAMIMIASHMPATQAAIFMNVLFMSTFFLTYKDNKLK
jgi:hypothetical protein